MLIRRLIINDHALLREARALLRSLVLPEPPYLAAGDLRRDIDAGPPATNLGRPAAFLYKPIERAHAALAPDAVVSGTMFYPQGGGLGWHTDAHNPGWRVYLAESYTGRAGTFYSEAGPVDDNPLYATAFLISGKPCDSWHAVEAYAPRAAIGIKVDPGGATARALGLDDARTTMPGATTDACSGARTRQPATETCCHRANVPCSPLTDRARQRDRD